MFNPVGFASASGRYRAEETEAGEARAREKLELAAARDASRARAALAAAILTDRRARADRAVYRRCFAIARSTVGDRAVIDLEDFKRFVHRGLEVEGIDQWELKRLYTSCLQGRPGSRVAVSDTLDVEQLRWVIERGQWARHWTRFVRDARWRALERGPGGSAAAIFGATSEDPVESPLFPGPEKALASPLLYASCLLRFAALPLLWPLASYSPRVAEAMYVTRFMLPDSLRRWRWGGAASLPLAFYILPPWVVGLVVTGVYAAHRPEFLLGDVVFPALTSAMLASVAASAVAASVVAGTTEHPSRNASVAIRPSYAFPGGRAALPDDQSRIVQNHPRLDTVEQRQANAAKVAAAQTPFKGGTRSKADLQRPFKASAAQSPGGLEDGVATAPGVSSADALAHALARDSAKESSPEGPRRDGRHVSLDLEPPPETTRGVRTLPMGGVGGGGKGRRGRAAAAVGGGGQAGSAPGVLGGLQPAGAARNDEAREAAARGLGSNRRRAEAAFVERHVSERDVAEAIVRRAAEEAAATPMLGSSGASTALKLVVFLVALAVAALPAAHRRVHGVAVFGGRERVTMCVDQLMPEAVIDLIGFARCSKKTAGEMAAAAAARALSGSNGTTTAPPPPPGVGEGAKVEDLIMTSTANDQVGSTAGHVIVGGGVLWMSAALYALLMALRWLSARCYEHYLRLRLFAACSDPAEAALMDVPYLNIRHAWLPWLRVRLHLYRLQHLERRWTELAVAHLFLAIAGLLVAAGLAAARIFTSPYQDVDLMLPACLTLALVLCAPLALILGIGARVYALQEDDDTLVADEKWKMTLDGVDDWQRHAAMTDLGDVVRRRNSEAWPRAMGVRCGGGVANAVAALAIAIFVVLAGVIALEMAGGLKEGTSGDQLRDYVEVNFAYTHKFSQRLLDRLLRLSDNVTRVEAGVALANDLISGLDNVSPRAALDIVRDMQRCHDCTAPTTDGKLRPWYADANMATVKDALNRHFYKKVPRLSELCPPTASQRQPWCDAPVASEPPLGKAECTNVDLVRAECTNLQYPPSPPPAPPPPPPLLPGQSSNETNATAPAPSSGRRR